MGKLLKSSHGFHGLHGTRLMRSADIALLPSNNLAHEVLCENERVPLLKRIFDRPANSSLKRGRAPMLMPSARNLNASRTMNCAKSRRSSFTCGLGSDDGDRMKSARLVE